MNKDAVTQLCAIIELQNDIICKQNAALDQLGAVCCEDEKARLEERRCDE